jgi:hypothetical protein
MKRNTSQSETETSSVVLEDALMTTAEAARFIGVSVWWLVKARTNGRGPRYIKIGRAVRYSKNDLIDFIKCNTHE